MATRARERSGGGAASLWRWLPALLFLIAACARAPQPGVSPESAATPTRISMAQLHAAGGVPPGWHFTPPAGDVAAGRQAFADFGCTSCHTVQHDLVPQAAGAAPRRGPDLSGMGRHHPAEYFAESILNPNAVIVDGPDYAGPDGRSIMPAYPEMTLRQLADLVAYLQSLTGDDGAHAHAHRLGPRAGESAASTFFVQAYALPPDQLERFYDWFDGDAFRKYPGLVSVQTFVGRRQGDLLVVAVFGFETELAIGRFVQDSAAATPSPDDFVKPVQRYILRSPALYKANGMSLP
jgi:mono/diheme cytochrome c family protein